MTCKRWGITATLIGVCTQKNQSIRKNKIVKEVDGADWHGGELCGHLDFAVQEAMKFWFLVDTV